MATIRGMHERQVEDLYREDDAPITNVRRGALRLMLYGGVGIFVLMIIASILIRIPREIAVPFTIKSDTREVSYRFAENTQVLKMKVKVGQIVHRGDTLATVTSPTIVSLLNQYTTAVENRRMFESSDVPINQNTKENLALQRNRYQSQINDAKKERQLRLKKQTTELDALQQELTAASKHLAETKKLFSQGFAADKEVRDAQLKENSAKDALNRTRQQYGIELSALDERIRQAEIDQSMVGVNSHRSDLELSSRRSQLESAIQSVRTKIHDLFGDAAYGSGCVHLLAPADLTVSYAYDEEREAEGGSVIIKLISSPTKLYASAPVEPQHVGTVIEGASAALKVSSFPYYHWGMVRGVIIHKALTPDDKGSYPVEIELRDAGQMSGLLQIGMSGEADVLVDNRPLMSYVFEKIVGRFQ